MYNKRIFKCPQIHTVSFIFVVITCVCVIYNINYLNEYSVTVYRGTDNRLGDLKNFEYLLNSQSSCDECKDFLLVILVHTSLENVAKRTAIRDTWGKRTKCIKVLYLMGKNTNTNLAQEIQIESDKHHDIVQGNFIDSYRNLTYKHLMALKWSTEYCHQAKYVVKTDDDVMVNTNVLYDNLKKDFWGPTDFIGCTVKYNTTVYRSKSRWSVTTEEFAGDRYPDYCLGPFIIYSSDVVRKLLEESYKTPYFWIDDVHVSGVLAKRIGIKHVNLINKWYLYNIDVLYTKGAKLQPFIYGPIELKPKKIYGIWNKLKSFDGNGTRFSTTTKSSNNKK